MTQLVTLKQKSDDMRGLIERYKPAMANVLPKHLTPERMARIALHATIKTPKLLDCTKESVIGSILECATLGLEPGVGGQCWILPYGDKATFIAGYRGLIQLARRSGQISTIFARAVYEKDEFSYQDYPPKLQHKRSREEDRGELVAAYAVCRLTDGGEQWEVMERHEIMKIKARSPGAKKDYSPWNSKDDEPEMWKKTALRKLSKMLPMSVELARATDLDEAADLGIAQDFEVPPAESLDPKKEVRENGNGDGGDMEAFAQASAAQMNVYLKQLDEIKDKKGLTAWRKANDAKLEGKLLPDHQQLVETARDELENKFA